MVALHDFLGIALGLVGFMATYLLVGIPFKFAGSHRLGKSYSAVFYLSAPCYSPTTWDRSPSFSPERVWPAVRSVLFWGVHCVVAKGLLVTPVRAVTDQVLKLRHWRSWCMVVAEH